MKRVFFYLSVALLVLASMSCTEEKKNSHSYNADDPLKRFTLEHAGFERSGYIYVPESYDGSTPFSLLFALHGNGGSAGQFHSPTLDLRAEELQFIVVYPDGYQGSWEVGPGYDNGVDDKGFFKALIADFSSQYAVDRDRIYVTGHSLGGFMAYRLGKTLSDELAAIAPVSGMSLYALGEKEGVSPLAVMHIHSLNDSVVPYAGHRDSRLPSAEDSVNYWKDVNDASLPQDYFSIPGVMTGTLWSPEEGSFDVAFLQYKKGGHSWPTGATERICHFFYNHPPRQYPLEFDLNAAKKLYLTGEPISIPLKTEEPSAFSEVEYFLNQEHVKSSGLNTLEYNGTVQHPGFYMLTARARLESGTTVPASIMPEFYVVPPNIAQGQESRSSSVESNHLGPANGVDGDLYTRFSSRFNDRQWYEVDLGSVSRINGVSIIWENAWGRDFDIELSIDGKKWKRAAFRRNGLGGMDYLPFPEAEARYVRLKGIKRGTNWGYSFWEFMVHSPDAY